MSGWRERWTSSYHTTIQQQCCHILLTAVAFRSTVVNGASCCTVQEVVLCQVWSAVEVSVQLCPTHRKANPHAQLLTHVASFYMCTDGKGNVENIMPY
jgi:hypothetical protein